MVLRILLMIALSIEIAIALGMASIFALGGLPENPIVLLWALGAVIVVSGMIALGLPESITSRVATHGALIAGSVVFALPFFWLVGTSFKYPEETFAYPPRWIPKIPAAVSTSPYIARTEYHGIAPAPFEAMIWETAEPMLPAPELASVDRASARSAVTGVLWELITATHTDPSAAAIATEVNVETVAMAWERVFRTVALGAVTVYDQQRIAAVVPADQIRWRGANALLVSSGGSTRVQYNFDDSQDETARLEADIELPFAAGELFQVSIGIRQDRSWHPYRAELGVGEQRYVSTHSLYLGDDGYREIGFKIGGEDLRDIGVFTLKPDSGATLDTFNRPDTARLTLTIEKSSRLGATWAKYTQAYRDAWYADPNWPSYLVNTAILVTLTVVGQILSCTMVAYAFARLRWPGRASLFALLLATMMLPMQVTMIPVFLIFKSIGWYNTLLPLWVPAFLASPFFVFLLRQFMRSIPRDIEEAALIDGCSWYGIYWRIILPLMKPGIAAVGIFTFMGTWNEFMGPLIYLSDSRLYPLAMGLYTFRSEHGGEFGMLMAASTIMIMPVIALFFFTQRYFIEGITLTGVKG